MLHTKDLKKEFYTTGEIAKMAGLNYRTINAHRKQGLIKLYQDAQNSRWLGLKEDVLAYLDLRHIPYVRDEENEKHNVVYARVSSNDQKQKGDLDRQIGLLCQKIKDSHPLTVLSDVGSGLNSNRKGLNKLIQMVSERKVAHVYIAYKDRLTRFGYEYLEKFFQSYGADIVIMEDKENKSDQEELVEDLMALIASFSGRFYGMRSKDKKRVYSQLQEVMERADADK